MNTLLTGLPRSGTTLLCAILNKLPNTVALAEPMPPPESDDPDSIITSTAAFAAAVRVRAISDGMVPTRAIAGKVIDNFVEAPNSEGRLRKPLSQVLEVAVDKPLTPDFQLYIKHPALFTALIPHIRNRIALYALIREPLSVLAAWQTVDMPVNRGYLPAAERVDPSLRARLNATPDRLDRQVEIMAWFLRLFAQLPPRRLLRYEDLVRNPDALVAALQSPASRRISHEIYHTSASDRYPGVDMAHLAQRLLRIAPLIEVFYPHYRELLEATNNGKPAIAKPVDMDGQGKRRVDFFIAGAQKAGTTALACTLSRHASIRMANTKEVHFFDDSTKDWDNPDYEDYHCWFRPSDPTTTTQGEATPIYLYQPEALDRILRYNPAAKFIICLRHPAFRAYSHWRMETMRGHETWDFGRAITLEGRLRILDGDRPSRLFSYVERGFYARQLNHLLNRFPREQIHILRMDQLWNDQSKTLMDICVFLGVTPIDLTGPSHYIVPIDCRTMGCMSRDDRRKLDGLFRQDIEETQSLTGLNLSDWLDPGYEEMMPSMPGNWNDMIDTA